MAEKRIPTAAYCRLSRENDESILTQENYIKRYIRGHAAEGFDYIQSYIDDGKTGTNYNRPGWKELLEDCKRGLIKCIIVKDLSRLGREYIETGKLMEEVLPGLGVRLIAILDHYDSKYAPGDIGLEPSLMNVLNDYYAENASQKIHDALNRKMIGGEWLGRVPYGYKKAGPNKEYFVIDPDTSKWVKQIFKWYLEGYEIAEIIELLEENQVPTPTGKQERWSHPAVKNLLSNDVYCGDYRQHKETRELHKKSSVPEEDQIVIRDHHTAIIDRETFQQVKDILEGKHRPERTAQNENKPNGLLSGIFYCALCGKKIQYQPVDEKKRVKTAKYFCQYHTGKKAKGAPLEKRPEITEDTLKQTCMDEYNAFRERVLNHQWTPEVLIKGTIFDDDFSVTTEELMRKIEELRAQKEEYLGIFYDLYERYVKKQITKEEFMELRDELVSQYHPLELDLQISKATLQETEFMSAELIRKNIELTQSPMTEFDEAAFMKATNFVELNPDGTLHILFADEEAFKLSLDIAYDRKPDE